MIWDYDSSFDEMIGEEGGYVNDPKDPGGETKFGISKRSYPDLEIAGLTRESVKPIYLSDFWNEAGCDSLPSPVNFIVFDTAVNSGVRTAAKILQQVLEVVVDGNIGPGTRAAIQGKDPIKLAVVFCAARLEYMTTCSAWQNDGKGWARRVASNLKGIFE